MLEIPSEYRYIFHSCISSGSKNSSRHKAKAKILHCLLDFRVCCLAWKIPSAFHPKDLLFTLFSRSRDQDRVRIPSFHAKTKKNLKFGRASLWENEEEETFWLFHGKESLLLFFLSLIFQIDFRASHSKTFFLPACVCACVGPLFCGIFIYPFITSRWLVFNLRTRTFLSVRGMRKWSEILKSCRN